MPLTAKETTSNYELPPEGTELCICNRVIDLGLQFSPTYNTTSHKILLGFRLVDTVGTDGQALDVSNRYTLSLSEKAILRKHLESWRGRAFSAEELKGFDVTKLLGVPALVTIKHDMNPGNGKTYANIAGISALPKSMAKPAPLPADDLVLFVIGETNEGVLDGLHEKLAETVRAGMARMKQADAGEQATKEHQQAAADFDDDIPF